MTSPSLIGPETCRPENKHVVHARTEFTSKGSSIVTIGDAGVSEENSKWAREAASLSGRSNDVREEGFLSAGR
jgi:hypothetical protein